MEQKIKEHIDLLAEKENVNILFAIESGSRAWGCPSPDSDYDVRIVYSHPKEKYLQIDNPKESMDYFHGKLLDINGWDIKKALKLIRKSNATPFEWSQSPIVYKDNENFRSTILDLSRAYFQPHHTLNHYKGIAKNSYWSSKDGNTINLKKLFYVLRPIMAAKWIIEKKSVPPMDIPNLLPMVKDAKIVDEIKSLLAFKLTANEDHIHEVNPIIMDFIEKEFEVIATTNLDKIEIPDNTLLNDAFLKIINSTNDN